MRGKRHTLTISFGIRDEDFRRVYEVKELPLLTGIGSLLAFSINKLGISFIDIFKAEVQAEVKEYQLDKEQISKSLTTAKEGG